MNRARRGKKGKNEGKRAGGKGPEKALEKLCFWCLYDLGTLQLPSNTLCVVHQDPLQNSKLDFEVGCRMSIELSGSYPGRLKSDVGGATFV